LLSSGTIYTLSPFDVPLPVSSTAGPPQMDTTEPRRGASEDVDPELNHSPASPDPQQELPDDLPKSLDDRRSVPVFQQETEMYDAWQGECSLSGNPRVNMCFGIAYHPGF
jgi:hypothetical protein